MEAASYTVPPHVPPSLVRDFDYFDQAVVDGDAQAAWMRLQDGPDIIWTPRNGGHWIVTRGSGVRAAASDNSLFSSRTASIPPAPEGSVRNAPLEYDPPDHTRLKQMGLGSFGPRAIGRLQDGMAELANRLIDGFIAKGRCEFVDDFGLVFPIETFMKMGGLPLDDRLLLLGWIDDRVRNPDPEVQRTSYENVVAYSRDVIKARRANPGSDLISELCAAAAAGKASDEELLGYVTLMWFAGMDTVTASMGFFTRFLARNPAHRRQLIENPGLINNAVEEMLRRFGIDSPARVITRDAMFNGVEIRKGEMMLLPFALQGLDDREYDDPLKVDFNRTDAAQSLAFGTGVHRCLGSFLARAELRTFLKIWLERIPDFTLDPDDPPVATTGVINFTHRLPLKWDTARIR